MSSKTAKPLGFLGAAGLILFTGSVALALDMADLDTVDPVVSQHNGLSALGSAQLGADLGPRIELDVTVGTRWKDAQLLGCGHVLAVPADSFALQARGQMPCQLRIQAVHRVTEEPSTSAPVTIDGTPSDVVEVALAMPRRWGQLGLLLFPEGDGTARLTRLDGGTPSEPSSLVDGAVVLAVDGIPVGNFSPEELVALDGGPLGSEVVLTVLEDGEEVDIVVARELSLIGRAKSG